jgi:hypothetical protein
MELKVGGLTRTATAGAKASLFKVPAKGIDKTPNPTRVENKYKGRITRIFRGYKGVSL